MVNKKASPWSIHQYKIAAHVTGECYGDSGLAYHCDYDLWVDGMTSSGKEWVVDHLASGSRLATFNSQARARFFIEQIVGLTDWTVSADVLNTQNEVWEKAQEIYKFASEWKPEQANKLLNMRKQVLLRAEKGSAQ